MSYRALQNCKNISWNYLEVAVSEDINVVAINAAKYDFIVANYHEGTWNDINISRVTSLKSPKIMLCFERKAFADTWRVNTPWPLPVEQVFDYIAIPDPSMKRYDKTRVCKLPRIIERYQVKQRAINTSNPIISTFGLQTVYKVLDRLAIAVNNEFSKATLRLHFSKGDHVPDSQEKDTDDIISQCKSLLHPGITLEVKRGWWANKEQLISWLNESDLNVFFYGLERDYFEYGNIPASTDEAIASQRPLAITQNLCTVHLMGYIAPYPMIPLKESMFRGVDPVMEMYNLWTPGLFAEIFEKFIQERV